MIFEAVVRGDGCSRYGKLFFDETHQGQVYKISVPKYANMGLKNVCLPILYQIGGWFVRFVATPRLEIRSIVT